MVFATDDGHTCFVHTTEGTCTVYVVVAFDGELAVQGFRHDKEMCAITRISPATQIFESLHLLRDVCAHLLAIQVVGRREKFLFLFFWLSNITS